MSAHKIAKDPAICSVQLPSVKAHVQEANAAWNAATVSPSTANKPVLTERAMSSAQRRTVKVHAREDTASSSRVPLIIVLSIAGRTVPI